MKPVNIEQEFVELLKNDSTLRKLMALSQVSGFTETQAIKLVAVTLADSIKLSRDSKDTGTATVDDIFEATRPFWEEEIRKLREETNTCRAAVAGLKIGIQCAMLQGKVRAAAEQKKPQKHDLKVWPEYFSGLLDGTKTFECRYNDRNYQVGDFLNLHEWNPDTEEITGRVIQSSITYVLTSSQFEGLADGFVILGLKD